MSLTTSSGDLYLAVAGVLIVPVGALVLIFVIADG